LLIHQTRNELVDCGARFVNISAQCRAEALSKKAFGVDPVFRRPQTGKGQGSLYNVELEDFVADYYNTSRNSGKLRPVDTDVDPDAVGTPYGFFHREVPGYPDGFPVFLDIASTRNNLGNMLQYLKEGLYFDSMTRSVTAQAVMYNANLKQLANVVVMFNFTGAGVIDVTHKVTNMNVGWYTDWRDQNEDGVNDGSVQLGCEIVLAMMFAYAAMLELSELFGAIWDEGHIIRGLLLALFEFLERHRRGEHRFTAHERLGVDLVPGAAALGAVAGFAVRRVRQRRAAHGELPAALQGCVQSNGG
jgi:hypothetical protein